MIPDAGQFTHSEILSQPEAWADALERLTEERSSVRAFDPSRYDQVVFTGCGSTYYLSLAAAALTQALTGRPARAFPASELWLSPSSCYAPGRTLLVAVSRSGETTETLRACQAFTADGRGDLVTLSCYPETPLAGAGALNLMLPSGQERSVAQTRAFSCLFLGAVGLACLWAGREDLFDSLQRLPAAGRQILDDFAPLASSLGRDAGFDRFYFLGSGSRYGLACELSLKMKEMSLSHSEPFYFMEFRHGPKSMVTPETLVIGLRSTANAQAEAAVLADVQELGGRLLVIGEEAVGDGQVAFRSGLDEAVRDVLYLPVGQLVAFERALSKGLNPDRPVHLDTVVRLS